MTNPMKVLIGYDGSDCADAGLYDLHRAGLPRKVDAIVLSVADVLVIPESDTPVSPALQRVSAATKEARAVAKQAVEDARQLADRGSERVRTYFPDWTVRTETRADSPAWGIILEAEANQVDLIVVGSHGRSSLGRLVLGSVSQTVVTHARCSVRVARDRGAEANRPVRIIVGVDGSAQAQVAVRAVMERVWPPGSDVRIIAAIDPSLSTSVELPAVQEWTRPDDPAAGQEGGLAWVEKLVAAAAETLQAADITVSTLIQKGDPKSVLIEEAERWGADCIFVGARGLNRLERLLLGSVSTAVAARACCSVEVVRTMPAIPIDRETGNASL